MDCCPICLCDFESDYAFIPELQCSCVYYLHQECWNKWNNTCIYCRENTPGMPIIILANHIHPPYIYNRNLVCLLFYSTIYLILLCIFRIHYG